MNLLFSKQEGSLACELMVKFIHCGFAAQVFMMDADTIRYGIVLVTVASRDEAEKVAKVLVSEKLAACVSLLPVHSVYTWQSQLCQDEEWQLLIKTDLKQFQILETKIQEVHSYEVPEIVALPFVAASMPYLQWMGENIDLREGKEKQKL